jgi:DNA-binding GntR family transcriptional regulator
MYASGGLQQIREAVRQQGRVKSRVSPSSKLYKNEKPLRDIVSEEIRSRIFAGELRPGARLIERDLADTFEVSRFPVREALRALQNEGLVEHLPSRGMVVKTLNRQEVIELFDIREALEVLAARLAAGRAAQGSFDGLRRLVGESRAALDVGDLNAAHEANSGFHDEIIAMSGNALLESMLEPLLGRLHWLFRQISDFEQVSAEHAFLCEAILSGDPQRAASAARSHVLSYRRQTLEYLFG